MLAVCPETIMLQYVNPMAINTWAIAAKYPTIKQVGLCHSVQGTAYELARDLEIDPNTLRYRAAGINHMAFYLNFEQKLPDGTYKNLYPDLHTAYRSGKAPKPSHWKRRRRSDGASGFFPNSPRRFAIASAPSLPSEPVAATSMVPRIEPSLRERSRSICPATPGTVAMR